MKMKTEPVFRFGHTRSPYNRTFRVGRISVQTSFRTILNSHRLTVTIPQYYPSRSIILVFYNRSSV